jgi:hypothetical protein
MLPLLAQAKRHECLDETAMRWKLGELARNLQRVASHEGHATLHGQIEDGMFNNLMPNQTTPQKSFATKLIVKEDER